ncbi:sin3b protein [Moniliophthora roreri MCA 2997]|uniref:Sin3b protein n=2 Tax=Moniliophthora roreri TaxID=221103 RepID=V2YQ62_MONRO|nr:sin3b protein [Moniliophthora roreri MCA 2997]KAI3604587.1 sin3b protein [Moniliophthora roreri]
MMPRTPNTSMPDLGPGGTQRKPLPTKRQPDLTDALNYLDAVKNQFQDRPQVYHYFLNIMKDFKSWQIDTLDVIERVSRLFHGNPPLIQGFNTFLPAGYRIDISDGPMDSKAIFVTTPSGYRINTCSGPMNPDAIVVNMPKKPESQEEFNHAIRYLNRIKSRYSDHMNTYKQFLDIVATYQKERNQLQDSQVFTQVSALFKDAPDLLAEFEDFFPEAAPGSQGGIPQQSLTGSSSIPRPEDDVSAPGTAVEFQYVNNPPEDEFNSDIHFGFDGTTEHVNDPPDENPFNSERHFGPDSEVSTSSTLPSISSFYNILSGGQTTAIIAQSSGFTIAGGHFNNVHGDQVNIVNPVQAGFYALGTPQFVQSVQFNPDQNIALMILEKIAIFSYNQLSLLASSLDLSVVELLLFLGYHTFEPQIIRLISGTPVYQLLN